MKTTHTKLTTCLASLAGLWINATTTAIGAEGHLDCEVRSSRSGLPSTGDSPGLTSEPGWTLGTKRLLYYRVRFQDDANDPGTAEEAGEDLLRANAILRRMSYGSYGFTWAITPVLALAQTRDGYGAKGPDALLDDTRAAALNAGFDYQQFDLDVVRYQPVPGFRGGMGNLGRRGAWLQVAGAEVLVHELGHNLGLSHANFWDTGTPSDSPKISPPFPSNVNEGREGHAFDEDSLIGHESLIGPGSSQEYGDLFDLMGTGGATDDFNAAYKHRLGWLTDAQVLAVTQSGTYRLYAFDTQPALTNHVCALRVGSQALTPIAGRPYWIQFRACADAHPGVENGVQILWGDGPIQDGSSQLIDTTPGTSSRQIDATLLPGRTFADPLRQWRITPVARGGPGPDVWMDVAIQLGEPATNQALALILTADTLTPAPGDTVSLQAKAAGATPETLLYAWDLGDGAFVGNSNQVWKSWPKPGEYVVRCEATDPRGGTASKHLVVRVGSPSSHHISGRVADSSGRPLAGVFMHNGRPHRNAGDQDYVWTYTDSDGAYTLANLEAGSYTNGAFLFGYKIAPAGSNRVAEVRGASVENVDFVAAALPLVRVSVQPGTVSEGGDPAEFELARTGPTNEALTVSFSLSGTARTKADYVDFLVRRVTIPAGARSARLPLFALADDAPEGLETITLTAEYPSSSKRVLVENGVTNLITVYFPGWELLPQDGELKWHQTYPDFILNASSSATLMIRDRVLAKPWLALSRLDDGSGKLELAGESGATYVLQESGDLGDWRSLRTNTLEGAAWTLQLPALASQPRRYFRAIRQDAK